MQTTEHGISLPWSFTPAVFLTRFLTECVHLLLTLTLSDLVARWAINRLNRGEGLPLTVWLSPGLGSSKWESFRYGVLTHPKNWGRNTAFAPVILLVLIVSQVGSIALGLGVRPITVGDQPMEVGGVDLARLSGSVMPAAAVWSKAPAVASMCGGELRVPKMVSNDPRFDCATAKERLGEWEYRCKWETKLTSEMHQLQYADSVEGST